MRLTRGSSKCIASSRMPAGREARRAAVARRERGPVVFVGREGGGREDQEEVAALLFVRTREEESKSF
jgi:hypothetical protein